MPKVIVKLKIMPRSTEVNLKEIEENIRKINLKDVEIKGINVVPIAFGLKAISVIALMPDKEGICDTFIEKIKEVKNIQSVEVEAMDLL